MTAMSRYRRAIWHQHLVNIEIDHDGLSVLSWESDQT
jgi:hypothetical protein